MIEKYTQRGLNEKYPEEIEVWRIEDLESTPEWITDRAKIEHLDNETGTVKVAMNSNSTGGAEIINSDGQGILIKVSKKEDPICFSVDGKGSVFSLTNHQLELLYKKL